MSASECASCQQQLQSLNQEEKEEILEKLKMVVRRKEMFVRRRTNALKYMESLEGSKPRATDSDLDGYSINTTNVVFRGKFATIYSGSDNSGVGRERIAKVFELHKLPADLRFRLEASAKHLRYLRLHHSFCTVHIQEIFSTPDKLIIFMEKSMGSNLEERLSKEARMDEQSALVLGKDICRAVLFLHERGIAHENINGKHVIFSSSGSSKLSGFDWSVVYFDHKNNQVIPQLGSSKLHAHNHWSPEKTKDDKYDPSKADVWSFGLLLIMLMTKDDKVFDFKSSHSVSLQWKLHLKKHGVQLSHRLFKIFSRCFQIDPNLRSDILDVLLSIKLRPDNGFISDIIE
jgi:serine/threonine protein kinase